MNYKKNILLISLLGCAAAMSSCKPVNIPNIENIAPNETAFLVPLEGDREMQVKFDSEAFLEKNKISVGRIEIPKRWRETGRMWWDGEYIPTVLLIKVDRAPVTVQWEATIGHDGKVVRAKNDNSVWIESSDSVGFSTGWNLSAYIESVNASKFLYMYAGRPLKDVLNTEVHGRILEVSQEFASEYPLDQLREKKGEMSTKVQTDVKSFFKERGITITNVGMFGGFVYENDKIQDSIDTVFVAQQAKNTTKAKLDAQSSINETLISEAKATASAAQEKATGQAKSYTIEAKGKADAVALEVAALENAQKNPLYLQIQQLRVTQEYNTRWDGKLPQYYIGSDNVTTLMGIPDLGIKK